MTSAGSPRPVRRPLRLCAGAALGLVMAAALFGEAASADYRVRFDGAPSGLASELKAASTLASEARKLPSRTALRRVATADAEALTALLQSAGYYASRVETRVETEADKPLIVFMIDPGPLYRIESVEIRYTDEIDDLRPESLEAAQIAPPAADGAALKRAQEQFLAHLLDDGFARALIVERHVDADPERGTANAVFVFSTGPRVTFGALAFEGLDRVKRDYLEDLAEWSTGQKFERSALLHYSDQLAATRLFAEVDPIAGESVDGVAPILVRVAERKPRTIGAGIAYSTAEGPGGRLFFEHRNILGRAERILIEASATEVLQEFSAEFAKPLPEFDGGVFAQYAFLSETSDAFTARTNALSAGLYKRFLDDRLELRAAAALESSGVRSNTDDTRTYFLSTPLSALWNTEDDLLDPRKGVRASLTLTPTTGSDSFTQIEANARTRVAFDAKAQPVLAFRARLGSTVGSSLDALPANKRFFAGGGNSVRGFGFQNAGPLDAMGDPIGGRSVLEGAVELRAKAVKKFETAIFFDAATVSAASFPDLGAPFFTGAGAGLRYLSKAGPVRLDVAFPFRRREEDRAFQIYISLGQSF